MDGILNPCTKPIPSYISGYCGCCDIGSSKIPSELGEKSAGDSNGPERSKVTLHSSLCLVCGATRKHVMYASPDVKCISLLRRVVGGHLVESAEYVKEAATYHIPFSLFILQVPPCQGGAAGRRYWESADSPLTWNVLFVTRLFRTKVTTTAI